MITKPKDECRPHAPPCNKAAQGEFVRIAADVYRTTKDRAFLEAVFEPVVRASRFIDELCVKTNASHGPEIVAPSISHEGYSKPSFSY